MIYMIRDRKLIPQPARFSRFERRKIDGVATIHAYTRSIAGEAWYFLGSYSTEELAEQAVIAERGDPKAVVIKTVMKRVTYPPACVLLAQKLHHEGLSLRAISQGLAAEGFLSSPESYYAPQSINHMLSISE